jgi:uncharacterized protein involved in exopolysaccharide biosynthesis
VQIAEQAPASDHLTFTRWFAGVLLRWRIVAAVTIATLVVGLVATVIIPPVYRSNASFVANSSSSSKLQGANGASTGLSGIISQLGGSVGGDPSESPNFYVELLSSRELLTRLIESKFPNPRTDAPNDSATLLTILRIKKSDPKRQLELAVKKMRDATQAGLDPKTNLVWFSVDAQWPELSSQIGNRLIELVSSFNRETRVSRAKSKRTFLQMRRDSAQTALREAEERLRIFYEQNRGIIIAPSLKYEEQRIRRDGDLASDLYMNLDRQLEVARIDEINDAALITVIDSAVVPRKAQWPRYGVMLLTGTALGLLFGLLLAGSAAVLADWRERNPDSWTDFRSAMATTRSELGSVIGVRSKRHSAADQQPVSHPPTHSASLAGLSGTRSDESIARAQRPVA